MTDGKLVKAMARVYRLNEQIRDLMYEASNHPNGQALIWELQENGLGYTVDCASIAYGHLVHPERWECTHHGPLKWKGKGR